MNKQELTYFFGRKEFYRNGENWYDLYDPRWLVLVDSFRLATGICLLSPHPRALGRRDGIDNRSGYDGHNIDKHGYVKAGDTFPNIMRKENEYLSIRFAFHTARDIGFTGIGIYPQWALNGKRRCGLHLDVRDGVLPGQPVTWGYLDNKFVPMENAFNYLIDLEENG